MKVILPWLILFCLVAVTGIVHAGGGDPCASETAAHQGMVVFVAIPNAGGGCPLAQPTQETIVSRDRWIAAGVITIMVLVTVALLHRELARTWPRRHEI